MIEGKCPKCGARYYGWALNSPRNQICGYCGISLEITDTDGNTFTGYSPFTAEEYKIKTGETTPEKPEAKTGKPESGKP
jgi:hypothetical protein